MGSEGTTREARRAVDAVPASAMLAQPTFEAASAAVLAFLHEQFPLALWTVTRVENGRQTYLYLDDEANSYGLTAGGSIPWEDSFCIHMAAGTTPAVTTDVHQVPEYAAAAARFGIDVGTYAGAVIQDPTGSLFGVICGVDPEVRDDDEALLQVGPQLQLLGQLLSMVLTVERRGDHYASALLRAQLEAETDALTGLYNRHAWQRVIAQEESRLTSYGDPVVAVVVDLDRLKEVNDTRGHAAGDEHIRAAAAALREAVRDTDVVARLGGDEFGLLLPGCTEAEAPDVVERIYAELARAGVEGSVGWACVTPAPGFHVALAEADAAMYAEKASRRAARSPGASAAARA